MKHCVCIMVSALPLQDLCATLLPLLFPSILRGLQDVDDDVRAVAASSLLPVADQLVAVLPSQVSHTHSTHTAHMHTSKVVFPCLLSTYRSYTLATLEHNSNTHTNYSLSLSLSLSLTHTHSQIPQLLDILWNSLVDLDDLSASTSSILGLLCSLLTQNPQLYSGTVLCIVKWYIVACIRSSVCVHIHELLSNRSGHYYFNILGYREFLC